MPLAEQDRGRWDKESITEDVETLQAALARDRPGEFQAQAAVAAPHADASDAEETDWVRIVEWYDELARLTDSPVVRLNRAVAVGEADGPRAGPAALNDSLPRHAAVAAHLHERAGDLATAARLYGTFRTAGPRCLRSSHPTRTVQRHRDGRSVGGNDEFVDAVRAFTGAGFTEIALVRIGGAHQRPFLRWAEEKLLPALANSDPSPLRHGVQCAGLTAAASSAAYSRHSPDPDPDDGEHDQRHPHNGDDPHEEERDQ